MKSLLSTKKLQANQKEILFENDIETTDYQAINVEFLNFKTPTQIENAIVTSQNGAKSILKSSCSIKSFYCVGKKTKALLEQNDKKVIETTNYGADLAQLIVNKHSDKLFYFFCGVQRRDELPEILKNSNIDFIEVNTYKTTLKPRKFEQKWDGILFYSPSGVESYFSLNKTINTNTKLICIGNTTANAASKYSNNIYTSKHTTIESVIEKAISIIL